MFIYFKQLQNLSLQYAKTPFVLNEEQFEKGLELARDFSQKQKHWNLNVLVCKIAKAYRVHSFYSRTRPCCYGSYQCLMLRYEVADVCMI